MTKDTHGVPVGTMHMITGFQFSREDSPVPRKRLIPIKTIGATDQFHAVILAPTIWGCYVHWASGRSVPCSSGKSLCQFCLDRYPTRWKGYLHVLPKNSKETVFIELTDFAWARLKEEAGERENLRGLIVAFSRERKTVKAPIQVQVLTEAPENLRLPSHQTPEETLKRIWKIAD